MSGLRVGWGVGFFKYWLCSVAGASLSSGWGRGSVAVLGLLSVASVRVVFSGMSVSGSLGVAVWVSGSVCFSVVWVSVTLV